MLRSTAAIAFSFAATFLASSVSAQQSTFQVDCPNPSSAVAAASSDSDAAFQTYVNTLLTGLNTAGYTYFEELVAEFSELTEGYDVLEAIWNSVAVDGQKWSIVVPTNAAFDNAKLSPPFTTKTADELYSLFTYHVLASVPTTVPSLIETIYTPIVTAGINATDSGEGVKMSFRAGTGNNVKIVTNDGNATIPGGFNGGVINAGVEGLTLYQVDKVLTPPDSLVNTLTGLTGTTVANTTANATSTATGNSTINLSLDLFKTALNRSSLYDILTSHQGALTIFAPVDSAFTGNMGSTSTSAWSSVMKGHYSLAQTLDSSDFSPSTKLWMASSNPVTFVTNSTGSYVVDGNGSGSSAKILRSDVLMDNGGVLHVSFLALSLLSAFFFFFFFFCHFECRRDMPVAPLPRSPLFFVLLHSPSVGHC